MIMSRYNYEILKNVILTDQGQRRFLRVRDKIEKIMKKTGAFRMGYIVSFDTNSWFSLACVERMVEIGELSEVGHFEFTQHRVFVEK